MITFLQVVSVYRSVLMVKFQQQPARTRKVRHALSSSMWMRLSSRFINTVVTPILSTVSVGFEVLRTSPCSQLLPPISPIKFGKFLIILVHLDIINFQLFPIFIPFIFVVGQTLATDEFIDEDESEEFYQIGNLFHPSYVYCS